MLWLQSNLSTILVGGALFALLAVIAVRQWKRRGTCGCGCADCALKGECHKE